LIDEIERSLNLLLTYPLLGESVDHLQSKARRIMLGQYQLFYEPLADGIRLLRVYQAARRIEDLFD